MLLHVYMLTGPMVIGAFIKHPGFGSFLSFASVLGFFALNKTAEELEGASWPTQLTHRESCGKSFRFPAAARHPTGRERRARPPCRHFKNQSCSCLGLLSRVAAFQTAGSG